MNGMVEVLVRRRELFAVVLLVIVAAQIVLGLIGFVVDVWPGSEPVAGLAAVLLAISCALGTPTRHVRILLVLAVLGVVVVTGVDLGHGISAGLRARSNPTAIVIADVLLTHATGLVAAVAAAVVWGRSSAGVEARQAASASLPAVPDPVLPVPPVPLGQRPVWDVDQAGGAAWTTAGDAATGAPGTGWGSGEESGSAWNPIPRQPPVPPPRWDPDAPDGR